MTQNNSFRHFINRIKEIFTPKKAVDNGSARASSAADRFDRFDEHALVDLMQKLDETHEEMYSCAETFALLDEYVELVTTGEDAARMMPLVKTHLDHCPDCHEQYAVLVEILEAEKT